LPAPWTRIGLALRPPVSFSRSAARQIASREQMQERPVRQYPVLERQATGRPVREKVLRQAGAEPLRGLAMLEAATFVVPQASGRGRVRFAAQEPFRRQPAWTRGRLAGREPARIQIATQ
jgi:hypothetical protein